jgi:hypothetical protein
MNWDAIGALGELLGAAGVMASLIYLAVQVRQNTVHLNNSTRSMRDAALMASRAMNNEMTSLAIANPGLARLFRLGMGASPKLNADDRIRFDLFMFQWFSNVETLFLLHQRGSLEVDQWIAAKTRLRMILATPGGRDSWERQAATLGEPFRDFVLQDLRDPPAV